MPPAPDAGAVDIESKDNVFWLSPVLAAFPYLPTVRSFATVAHEAKTVPSHPRGRITAARPRPIFTDFRSPFAINEAKLSENLSDPGALVKRLLLQKGKTASPQNR